MLGNTSRAWSVVAALLLMVWAGVSDLDVGEVQGVLAIEEAAYCVVFSGVALLGAAHLFTVATDKTPVVLSVTATEYLNVWFALHAAVTICCLPSPHRN